MKKITICIFFILILAILLGVYYFFGQSTQEISCFTKTIKRYNQSAKCFLQGEFFIPTGLQEQPKVKVEFLIPCDQSGRIIPEAADVVFYAPGSNCRGSLTRTVLQAYPLEGLSLFTLEITSDMKYFFDPVKSYERISSGWHEVIFRAYQLLCKKFSLPAQKLLLLGESSGSNMAQGLAATFPDKFDAVAFVGGNHFYCSAPEQELPWLILNTWQCFGTGVSTQLAQDLNEKNHNVLRTFTIPDWNCPNMALYFHTPSLEAYDLMRKYLVEIAKLRRNNGGIVPQKENWPVQLKIGNETFFFPSEFFAEQWDKLSFFLPQKASKKTHQQVLLSAIRDFNDPPAEDIVFLQDFNEDPFLWLNSVYYLQAMGYNVITYYNIPHNWFSLSPFGGLSKISIVFSGKSGSKELVKFFNCHQSCKQIFLLDPGYNAFVDFFEIWKKDFTSIPLIVTGVQGYLLETEESNPEINLTILPSEKDFFFPKKSYDLIFPRLSTMHKIW